jgi:cytoskeletal protein RodZ
LDEDRAVNAYAFSNQEQRPDGASDAQRTQASIPSWLPWVVVIAVLAAAAILLSRSGSSSMEESASETSTPNVSEPARSTPVADDDRGVAAGGDESAEALAPTRSTSSVSAAPTTPSLASSMVPVLTPSRESAPASEGVLRMVVAVGESCWLEIEADGMVVTTGLKEQGFRQEFTADDELRLWLGNAGGVSFWVNDRPLRSLGRAGQVRKDLSITRDNFMDYVTREPGSS